MGSSRTPVVISTSSKNSTSSKPTKRISDSSGKSTNHIPDDDDDDLKVGPGTPLTTGTTVPVGHCLVNEKWRSSPALVENIRKKLAISYTDGMGVADFQPGNNTIIMIWSEAEIVLGEAHLKEKLKKFYKQKRDRAAVVVFHKTPLTSQYLPSLEQLALLDFTLPVVPLVNLNEELGQVLQQFEAVSRKQKNPFRVEQNEKKKLENVHKNILLATLSIPGVGEKKARLLLKKFGTLRGIARAKRHELTELVGDNLARGIDDFFRRKNTV